MYRFYAEFKKTQGMSQTISPVPFTSGTEAYSTEALLEEECLRGRKWWCFLLSSIFTFLAGLLIVLLWRAFAFLCCRKEPELSPNDPKQKEQKANRQGKQEFEGTFMTEAKDWAGELISGQTTTGRILVSSILMSHPQIIDNSFFGGATFTIFAVLWEWAINVGLVNLDSVVWKI